VVTTLTLTGFVGVPVVDADGARVGRLSDLAARLDAPVPVVTRLLYRSGPLGRQHGIPFSAVAALDASPIRLSLSGEKLRDDPLHGDELLLRRHVLDAQIVDLVGRRLTRVEDVLLDRDGSVLRVAGVEVGAGAALQRLGLGRIAGRLPTRVVPWDALHLTSGRGHALQLEAAASAFRRLGPEAVGELAARLPAHHAEQLLAGVRPETATEARGYGERALRKRPRRFRLARARLARARRRARS
jgi:sporulation protein YlmC with PRC-barrel domain